MSSEAGASGRFARVARAALEKSVVEARTDDAQWGAGPNFAWVRWSLLDGWHATIGLRRHLDWVTAEVGLSPGPIELDALPLLTEPRFDTPDSRERGGRIRLGLLLHDDDRWWPAGESERELSETLVRLALQLRAKAERLLSAHAGRPA